ncbi:MAG: glycosyltransferase [Gemmatimonadota bacterium]|nr:glycosyltransferase [Gemmatimonadota bacterium]
MDRPIESDFAVVIPAYDEVENMGPLFDAMAQTWRKHGLEGEVILVDDGSEDGTAEAARSEAGSFPAPVRVLRHRRNRGKTEALLTGVDATDRGWIVLYDADLQHSPEEIPRFLEKLAEGNDVVTGWKQGPYEKRFVSKIYNRLSRTLFDVPVHDLNSMKAFRRDLLYEIPLRHDWHRFFVVLAHDRGYRIDEIPIDLHPRRRGEAKYSGLGRVVVGTLDLVAVKTLVSFMRKPLILFGALGTAMGVAGLAVGGVAVYYRFVLDQGYRPLLYLVVLLVTLGTLFFAMGFLGEAIAHVRDRVEILERRLRRGPGDGDPRA